MVGGGGAAGASAQEKYVRDLFLLYLFVKIWVSKVCDRRVSIRRKSNWSWQVKCLEGLRRAEVAVGRTSERPRFCRVRAFPVDIS